jgi:hypothetical protein
LNHLVLEHLSGVKGGFPLKEAYYLNYLFFKALSTFPEVFLCYIDVWFLTDYGGGELVDKTRMKGTRKWTVQYIANTAQLFVVAPINTSSLDCR